MKKNSTLRTLPAKHTLSLPRNSLISQAAQSLREHIYKGTWINTLPGERRLCEMLMISRPTLRSALAILEKENLLQVSQGKLRTINLSIKNKISSQPQHKIVTILCPDSASEMSPTTLFLIDETYNRLQKAGYTLDIHSPAWLKFKRPEKHLHQYVQSHPSACWALFSVSEAVQKWFSNHSVKSIVSGTLYPGVNLPNIDIDSRAATIHAVGMLLRYGYRHITLITPEKQRPGHVIIQKAFLEVIQKSRRTDIVGRILRASAQKHVFERQLAEHIHFKDGPHALLIIQPLEALFTISSLLRKGVNVGKQVAIISIADDFYYDYISPTPARYRIDRKKFATKFCRLLLQLAHSDSIPIKSTLITTDFLHGETLQQAEGTKKMI